MYCTPDFYAKIRDEYEKKRTTQKHIQMTKLYNSSTPTTLQSTVKKKKDFSRNIFSKNKFPFSTEPITFTCKLCK